VEWVETSVLSLYVRRELRTLTEDDRDAFFDAAQVLFSIPTNEGRELFGDRYVSVGTFAMDHNTLAGNKDCDHLHDGLGFLMNHGALTVGGTLREEEFTAKKETKEVKWSLFVLI